MLPLPRTEAYYKNVHVYNRGSNHEQCCICGWGIEYPEYWVSLTDDLQVLEVGEAEDTTENCLGWFPVGLSCLKKLPKTAQVRIAGALR